MPLDADTVSAAVVDALTGEPDVVAAWVFGSVVAATAGPLSDIDVALAFTRDADRDLVSGRVADRLARRLRTGRVDLVSFDRASSVLRHRILRDGRRVICRDRAACERLAADAVMRYLDFQPVYDRALEQVAGAIRGR
jgi:predicted nucleotidyltransferase